MEKRRRKIWESRARKKKKGKEQKEKLTMAARWQMDRFLLNPTPTRHIQYAAGGLQPH